MSNDNENHERIAPKGVSNPMGAYLHELSSFIGRLWEDADTLANTLSAVRAEVDAIRGKEGDDLYRCITDISRMLVAAMPYSGFIPGRALLEINARVANIPILANDPLTKKDS